MVNRSLRIVGGLVFFSSLLWTILQPSEISVLVTSLGLAIGVLSTSNNRATNLHPKYRALIYCCCFVTLNIALYMVVSKYELVFDTTPAKNHTLQPQTINFLRDLKTPIHIVSFLEPQSPAEIHFANLIDRFQTQTNQITLEFVNPITNPERSETFQELLPQGSIFLQTNGKTTPLPFSDLSEQGLLNNIVQVTSNSHRICFIYGHGEADPKHQ